MSADLQRVKTLLTETIVLLCKSGLHFKSEFTVEGLLGITIDKSDIFLINLKETIKVSNHLRNSDNPVDFSISPNSQKNPSTAGGFESAEVNYSHVQTSKHSLNNSEQIKYTFTINSNNPANSNNAGFPLETNLQQHYNSPPGNDLENHGKSSHDNPDNQSQHSTQVTGHDKLSSQGDSSNNNNNSNNNSNYINNNNNNMNTNNNVIDSVSNLINKIENDSTEKEILDGNTSSNEYSNKNDTLYNTKNDTLYNTNVNEINKNSNLNNDNDNNNDCFDYFNDRNCSYHFNNTNNNMGYSNPNNADNDNDKNLACGSDISYEVNIPLNVKEEAVEPEVPTHCNNNHHLNEDNNDNNNTIDDNNNHNQSFNSSLNTSVNGNGNNENKMNDLNESFGSGSLLDDAVMLDSRFPNISSLQNGMDFLNNNNINFNNNNANKNNMNLNNNGNNSKVTIRKRFRRNYHLPNISASSSVQYRSPFNNPFHLYDNQDLKRAEEQQVELLPGSGVLVSLSAYELFTGEQWSRGSKLVRRVVREVFPDEQTLARSSCLGKRMGGCHVGLDHHKVHTIKAFVQQRMPQVSHTEIVAAINECCRDIRAKLRKSYYRNNKTAMLLSTMKPV